MFPLSVTSSTYSPGNDPNSCMNQLRRYQEWARHLPYEKQFSYFSNPDPLNFRAASKIIQEQPITQPLRISIPQEIRTDLSTTAVPYSPGSSPPRYIIPQNRHYYQQVPPGFHHMHYHQNSGYPGSPPSGYYPVYSYSPPSRGGSPVQPQVEFFDFSNANDVVLE